MGQRNFQFHWRFFSFVLAVAIFSPVVAHTQTNDESKKQLPAEIKKPLSDEQLSVYKDFLKAWRPAYVETINLSGELDPSERASGSDADDCLRDFVAEVTPQPIVHRFTDADVIKMGLGAINLVDRETQRKDVQKNDPLIVVHQGGSVSEAVRNGFNHGLFIFSEIQFDKKHEHAVLTYTFYCGQECGNGGTVVLSRSTGTWIIISRCQQWIASNGRQATPCEAGHKAVFEPDV